MSKKKSPRQNNLEKLLDKFLVNNKDLKKSLEIFDITSTQYKQAVKPSIKVYTDNRTNFASFEIK